jgi:hypothetical protein
VHKLDGVIVFAKAAAFLPTLPLRHFFSSCGKVGSYDNTATTTQVNLACRKTPCWIELPVRQRKGICFLEKAVLRLTLNLNIVCIVGRPTCVRNFRYPEALMRDLTRSKRTTAFALLRRLDVQTHPSTAYGLSWTAFAHSCVKTYV